LTEPPYWAIYIGIFLFIFVAIFAIVKARQRKEPAYYWASGACFLLVIAFAAILLNQFLLFFAMMGLSLIFLLVSTPRMIELQQEETVKQKQETDVSTPLKMKDFLTWKAWIKLSATHGFRTAITLYLLTTIGIVITIALAFIILGLMTTLMAIFYTISFTVFYFIISYRQIFKALKEPKKK
jgi:hypothetical protein